MMLGKGSFGPAVVGVLLAAMGSAHAVGESAYAKIGPLGVGIGVGRMVDKDVGLRLGLVGGAEWTGDEKLSGIKYDTKFRNGVSLEAMADWYPVASSGFRLTGGLIVNGNGFKTKLTGKQDSSGNFSINDHTYSAAAVGSLKGAVKGNKVAPYFGIGWDSDRPDKKGWHLVGDAGLMYVGDGDVSLSASGAANNAALRQDLAAEKRQLSSKVHGGVAGIISIGASYSF